MFYDLKNTVIKLPIVFKKSSSGNSSNRCSKENNLCHLFLHTSTSKSNEQADRWRRNNPYVSACLCRQRNNNSADTDIGGFTCGSNGDNYL